MTEDQKPKKTPKPKTPRIVSHENPKLNPSEQIFCQEYVIDCNATRAYRVAYPKAAYNTARVEGSRALAKPSIQDEISRLMREMAERGKVRAEMVIKELALVAFGDMSLVAEWGDEGISLKPSHELGRDEKAIIKEIGSTPVASMGFPIGYDKKVKLHDKLKALEILAKHFNLLAGSVDDEQARKPIVLQYDPKALADFVNKKNEPNV
jgi:phage terminase small subunit